MTTRAAPAAAARAASPEARGGPPVLVDDLVKRYGGRSVVDRVSLSVSAGELVAVLGPNGAGKTTTVETVEGYRSADAGLVRVLGADPARAGRDHRARVGIMLQGGGFDPRARPLETIRQYAAFHAAPRDPGELLARVGLAAVARTPYRRLSGGERQRLSLAVAIVGSPEVLVLDEPAAGMDPEARAVTRTLIGEERDRGAAILLTSHDLTEVERLADRIVVLDEGRVVASGTPAALMGTVAPAIRIRLDEPLDGHRRAALELRVRGLDPGWSLDLATPTELLVTGAPPDGQVIAAIAAACADAGRLIVELRTTAPTLEDAYLALLAEHRTRDRR